MLEVQKAQNETWGSASLSEYNKLIGGSVPRHAGNTPALLARRCMAPSSSKGRHTPFQRTFLYLYIDPLTRIRGSFKDIAMRERETSVLARGSPETPVVFLFFSLRAPDFRYLRRDLTLSLSLSLSLVILSLFFALVPQSKSAFEPHFTRMSLFPYVAFNNRKWTRTRALY